MSGTGARIPLSWNHAERDGAMNWITGIQRALDYVEAHLMESVDYEEAAKQAYSSSFHFQRVFSILCGFTLGDYIRMRRLTLAGSELASSDIRVIDAALKYGYDTPESFSRAFTRFHGVPPSQAKHGAALKAFSPLSVKLTLDGGSTMDYRIETVEAFRLICRKKQIPSRAELTEAVISPFWRECTTDGTIVPLYPGTQYLWRPNRGCQFRTGCRGCGIPLRHRRALQRSTRHGCGIDRRRHSGPHLCCISLHRANAGGTSKPLPKGMQRIFPGQ